MEKDYNTYDYLSVSVKTENADELEVRYEGFGWEKIKRVPDAKFYNIELLTFRRDRKIGNKDRLQYLQVVMEHKINEIARLKKWQYLPSIIVTINLCLLDLLSIIGGALLIIYFYNIVGFISGGVLIGFGAILAIATIVINKRLTINDSVKYKALKLKLNTEIKQICEQVVSLTNEQNGTQPS